MLSYYCCSIFVFLIYNVCFLCFPHICKHLITRMPQFHCECSHVAVLTCHPRLRTRLYSSPGTFRRQQLASLRDVYCRGCFASFKTLPKLTYVTVHVLLININGTRGAGSTASKRRAQLYYLFICFSLTHRSLHCLRLLSPKPVFTQIYTKTTTTCKQVKN